MLSGAPTSLHQGSHFAVFESAMCCDVHGYSESVQNEHSEHLHIWHWVTASFGLHSGPHVAIRVSPGKEVEHAALGGGGDAANSSSNPSQKLQPRHPQSWQ